MKKVVLLFFILQLVSFTVTQEPIDFVGQWAGEGKGEIGFIKFDKEGYASFETKGRIIGGKEFILDGKKGFMTYTINTATDPIEIDFTITKLETKEEGKLLAIVKAIDKDSILIAMNFGGARPTKFNNENSMTFKRVK